MENVVTFDGDAYINYQNEILKKKNKQYKDEIINLKQVIIKLSSRIADLERKNKNDKMEYL